MKCKYCNAEIEQDALFCPNCGKDLSKFDKCVNCGELLDNDATFCPHCGTEQPHEEIVEESSSKKWIWILCAVLIIAGIGGWWYWDSLNKRVAREKAIADSLEIVRQDSIRLEKEKEKQREIEREKEKREAEIVLQKKQMLIPMDVVFDLYKHEKDKGYIKEKLTEYGYSFFKRDEDVEYWTKDVSLKECKDWRNDTYYEAVESKGSSVSIYEGGGFSLSIYAHKDFKEWERQLQELGYRYKKNGEELPEKNGWTPLGAHQNLCRQYLSSNGSVIEFMKDGDGHPGYDICSIEFAK